MVWIPLEVEVIVGLIRASLAECLFNLLNAHIPPFTPSRKGCFSGEYKTEGYALENPGKAEGMDTVMNPGR